MASRMVQGGLLPAQEGVRELPGHHALGYNLQVLSCGNLSYIVIV